MILLENFRGGEGLDHRASVGDNRYIGTFALDFSKAEGNHEITVRGVWNFAGVAVKQGIFHEIDWIVIADGGLDQSFGVGGGGGCADL